MKNHPCSRRQFLKSSLVAGGWVLTIGLPRYASSKPDQPSAEIGWCVYVSIRPDNSVLMSSPVMEMGQFMRTTGPIIIAEEMDLDWASITFTEDAPAFLAKDEHGKVVYTHAHMATGGSFAVIRNWDYMRRAGAIARQMLLDEAAERLGVEVERLRTKNNFVFDKDSERKISYGLLAEKAAKRSIDESRITLKEKKHYRLIGSDKRSVDARNIVTGKPIFGIDADYPNALQAVIDRAPALGADIASYDKKAALAVPGVRAVVEMEREEGPHWFSGDTQLVAAGVAVVADNLWSAMLGKNALATKWSNTGRFVDQDSEKQIGIFNTLVRDEAAASTVVRDDGNTQKAFEDVDFVMDEVYEKPLLAHACMEPYNCIADIRKNDATIVVGHQFPNRVAEVVEQLTGIDALRVEIISKRMGGGFGRRSESDFVKEAVWLSKKIAQPVKITWTREDELERGFFGPAAVMRIRAGVKDGKVSAWHHRQAHTKGGAQQSCFPAGIVKNYKVEYCDYDSLIPAGAWRGPLHLQWAFAAESMIDEIAHRLNADPLAFRLSLMKPHESFKFTNWGAESINSGRIAKVYEAAARLANWKRARPKGTGLGIAGHFTHGSYAAFVLEVSVSASNKLTLHQAWGAIDCGLAINPNHIRHQMEGGFIDGLNAALFNKVHVAKAQVQNNNFDSLRWMRIKEAPVEVESVIVKNDHSPTGVGEPPTAPAAAALGNAIFAASGKRIRRLPMADSVVI